MPGNSWLRLTSRQNNVVEKLGSERGAVLVEFAISFLPFFIVFSGVFGLLRLAFYFGTVEYMANEAVLLATQGGNPSGVGSSRVPDCNHACIDNVGTPCPSGLTGALTTRHCRVLKRLETFADTGSEVRISVGRGVPCTRPNPNSPATLIDQALGTNANAIELGVARELISVCVSYDLDALLPFNLLPINVSVSGIAIGRNEPSV
jgi:hypothetical protein